MTGFLRTLTPEQRDRPLGQTVVFFDVMPGGRSMYCGVGTIIRVDDKFAVVSMIEPDRGNQKTVMLIGLSRITDNLYFYWVS